MLPLIFLSTVLTHLTGGSAGREGAASRSAGSIGHKLGCLLKLDDRDLHIITAAGMAARVLRPFRHPYRGGGIRHGGGQRGGDVLLPPSFPASSPLFWLSWWQVSSASPSPPWRSRAYPELTFLSLLSLLALGGLCALVAILFCGAMQLGGLCYSKLTSRRWVRAALGGLVVVLLTLLSGTTDYNGAGMVVILRAVAGTAVPGVPG